MHHPGKAYLNKSLRYVSYILKKEIPLLLRHSSLVSLFQHLPWGRAFFHVHCVVGFELIFLQVSASLLRPKHYVKLDTMGLAAPLISSKDDQNRCRSTRERRREILELLSLT